MQNHVPVVFGLFLTATLWAKPHAPVISSPVRPPENYTFTFNSDLKPFYHGVASGDPTAGSVVLWTRVTPEQAGVVDVAYTVATDVQFQNPVATGMVTTDESRDYTVKVDVGGLQPGMTYFYYFSALNANSLIGRAKTTPEGPVDHLRFGVVSCSNFEAGYFNAYGMLAKRNDIDAVIHLGDYIYEYPAGSYPVSLPGRVNEPPTELLSLSDYRTRYAQYRLDENLIRLHQQHTMLCIWDDHESANGAYVSGASNHQPGEGDWEVRKAVAKQAYFEWMPIRDNPTHKIYRKVSYGSLCDLLLLDTRLEARVKPPPYFDTPDDPVRTMISQTQLDWLLNNFKSSTARWKVVGNQVLFTDSNIGFSAGAYDGTPDITNIDSIRVVEAKYIDCWESYPTQRNAIIDTIRNAEIDNVVIVSGDSHTSWAFDVTKKPVIYPDPDRQYLPAPNDYNPATREGYNKMTGEGSWAVEFGVPSVSSPNFDELIGTTLAAQFEMLMNSPLPVIKLEYNPHLKYVDLDRHGYVLLDLKPDTAQANFYYVPGQYLDTLAEAFGQGAFALTGENHVRLNASPSAPKSVEDPETPLLPFGTVGAKGAENHLALFSVNPNPAGQLLRLQFGLNIGADLQIVVYDLAGRAVQTEAPMHFSAGIFQYDLVLSPLPAGTYILRLETNGPVSVSRKIVVR